MAARGVDVGTEASVLKGGGVTLGGLYINAASSAGTAGGGETGGAAGTLMRQEGHDMR